VLAEAENARKNRAECRDVTERAAAKQIELQEKIIALEDELRETRRGLSKAQEALGSAGNLAPEVKKLQESSWRLRQDLAAAERVRFAVGGASKEIVNRHVTSLTLYKPQFSSCFFISRTMIYNNTTAAKSRYFLPQFEQPLKYSSSRVSERVC
jgi:hypothetical protein